MSFSAFKAYETCLISKFPEDIGEMKSKQDIGDSSITKEALMAEALSTYDTLILEKIGSHMILKLLPLHLFFQRLSTF